jgi:uncharacterized membrane protein YidH (DUF202 family)
MSLLVEGNTLPVLTLRGGISGIREFSDVKRIAQEQKWAAMGKTYFAVLVLLGVIAGGIGLLALGSMAWAAVSKRMPRWLSRAGEIVAAAFLIAFVGGVAAFLLYLLLIGPWIGAEKHVQRNIRTYVPQQLRPE